MNLLKHLFQPPSSDGYKNVLRKSFELFAGRKTHPNQQSSAEANLKSGELTPQQLAEVFHWLSLY
jgi:hypothetical protein